MRIALLIRDLSPGGAERQLVNLARGLHARGHEVRVATFYAFTPLRDALDRDGIPVRSFDKRGRWHVAGFLREVYLWARRERPDVVYSSLIAPNLVGLLLRALLPGTRLVWGVRASDMELERYDWLARGTFRAGCVFSRYVDGIVANSRAGAVYHVEQGYPPDRLVVIPNGIDTDHFRPQPEARAAMRTSWGLAERGPVIGLVGRLDPMKDHASFLAAAGRLGAERDDVRFVCVGDGPEEYRAGLLRTARTLGLEHKVVWAGTARDMPAVYSALDLLASTSAFGEGFPNVIGEAMACGVPCVVTDVGDSAQIVGRLGTVVSPGDGAMLARAWRRQLATIGRARSAELRSRIQREFSVGAMVERTEDVLRKVTSGRG